MIGRTVVPSCSRNRPDSGEPLGHADRRDRDLFGFLTGSP